VRLSDPRGTVSDMAPELFLEPWTADDLDLELRSNTPELKAYLGGLETHDQLVARHERFLALPVDGRGQMFRIALPDAPGVGSVGYWEREWRGEQVYEMGWLVLTEFQGRGIAAAAVRLTAEHAAAHGRLRYAHAYPKTANVASNNVCRRAGFTLVGEFESERPVGAYTRENDWRLDLRTV